MLSVIPKQFLLLSGLPVIMHTIRAFTNFNPELEIIIALPDSYVDYWKELCARFSFSVPHTIARGGSTRFESVKNALDLVSTDGLVAVHDAVRPLVSRKTLTNTFNQAFLTGNAIPVIPVVDSIRQTEGETSIPINRANLRVVQTPQVFRKERLKKAYAAATHSDFSDDATVMEAAGEKIYLVEGNIENIKITHPADLHMAEKLIGEML